MSRREPRDSIEVLGPLRASQHGRQVQLPPAQRRLLSLLLLEHAVEVERDRLIDRLWGERAPATAVTALQVHASGLRRALPGLLASGSSGYRVDAAIRRYDRREFEEAAQRAAAASRAGDWAGAVDQASDALSRWRGTPFPDLREDEFALPTIQRLAALRLELLEFRARGLLALGRAGEASAMLSELVTLNPLIETLWEQLMLAHYRAGRRAEALLAYERCRRILAVELGVEPGPDLRELQERMLAADPELAGAPHRADHGLPSSSTSFIGREGDLRQLADLLVSHRLVTIVGAPGLGKTRLALEVAETTAERYPAGAWFASLAEASSPLEVIGEIVTATGLRGHARDLRAVARLLAPRAGLLVIDNCEHLQATCAELAAAILADPTARLRLLATSRRPLAVVGEQLWAIEPLSLPAEAGAPPDTSVPVSLAPVAASAAARLFVDRARSVDRTFRLTAETAPAIANLCRRADGIPLVLELAARWVQALGLDDIADMLATEPHGGAPIDVDHHRSLAAAIEWSMALLPPDERRLFVLCAVFNGRFGLDDIRAVCAPDQERRRLAQALAGLVDASLIVAERRADGTAMYRLLAPIREFARGVGEATADWPAARERLAAHYLAKAYADRTDPLRQVADLASVDRDFDNLRQAMEIGLELGRADDVARFVVATEGYWLNRYLIPERGHWLERALEDATDPTLRAHVLRALGSGAQVLGELDRSLRYLEHALTAFRQLDARDGLAHALASLSGLLSSRGDWSAGLAAANEAAEIAIDIGSTSGQAIAAYYCGENLSRSGEVEAGLAKLAEAARLFQQSGELGRAAHALSTHAYMAALAGDAEQARQTAPQALALAAQSASAYRRVRALGAAALTEARFGDAQAAGRMLLEARALMEPYELDDIFVFLLPSVFLLGRAGEWQVLARALRAADAAVAASGAALPQPWRAALQPLRDEIAAQPGAAGLAGGSAGLPSLAGITGQVMSALADGGPAG